MNILLIDDDPNLRKSLRLGLETMNHRVTEAADGAEATDLLGHRSFDVAFLDLRLGKEHGLDVLPSLLRLSPSLSVIVVTAYATIETAVEAMRRGAFDYLPKPFTPNQLRIVLDRVTSIRQLQSHVEDLEAQVQAFVPEAICRRRNRRCGWLWTWPSRRPRARRPFCCAAKAAPARGCWPARFMPTVRARPGPSSRSIVRACRPTCWKASCSATSRARSPAPFRTLSARSRLPGKARCFSTRFRRFAARLATQAAAAAAGTAVRARRRTAHPRQRRAHSGRHQSRSASRRRRRDAFARTCSYRLNVIEVTVPPLRQRSKDIMPLAEHLLRFFARQTGKSIAGFTEEARPPLCSYPWPGNVRELRNAIERGVILSGSDQIGLSDLPAQVGATFPPMVMELGGAVTLEQLEAEHIRRVLANTATMERGRDAARHRSEHARTASANGTDSKTVVSGQWSVASSKWIVAAGRWYRKRHGMDNLVCYTRVDFCSLTTDH